ncbi:AraC-like DNA-binding protein [Bradyrhizobium niftali]
MSSVKTKDGVEIFYKDWGQDILRDTDASVSSIAATLGYSSQTAFAAAFRKLTGKAPSDWQRRAC